MAGRDPKTGKLPKGNGAGKGDGWGGPAKGASASRIRPGDPEGIQAMGNDPDVKAKAEQRGELVREHLFNLALGAARQETQVAAAVAYLDRTEGKPVQRNVNLNTGDPSQLSDADLAAIAQSGRAAPAEAAADTQEPGGVVH